MAVLGLALVVICIVQLPSAYRFQTKFNERSKSQQNQKPRSAGPRSALDAQMALCLHTEAHWPGASESEC